MVKIVSAPTKASCFTLAAKAESVGERSTTVVIVQYLNFEHRVPTYDATSFVEFHELNSSNPTWYTFVDFNKIMQHVISLPVTVRIFTFVPGRHSRTTSRASRLDFRVREKSRTLST